MLILPAARRARLCLRLSWAYVPVAAFAVALGSFVGQTAAAEEQSAAPLLDADAGSYHGEACNCEACDAACCEPYMTPGTVRCSSCCPCSYAWAEGLILTRDNQSANRPLVLDLNTDEVLLTVGDLDFDWSGGLRVGYGQRVCDCWGVEFGYLGYFDQSAVAGVELDDGLTLPGDLGLQVNNFFAADDVGVRYTSDLHSAEVNFVHCCAGCGRSLEWLAGFRYLDLGERIGITAFDSAESTTRYDVRTSNHLYGAQLGARARRCLGCWSWEATGKAGIYGNDMQQHQAPIIDFPDFEFRSARGSSDGDVAFVGDLNFSGSYQLTRVWGVRAGYNLIWIEGVALRTDQLDFTNVPGSGTDLVSGAGVFLHGVNVGLEARW